MRSRLRRVLIGLLKRAGVLSDQQWCRVVMDRETSRLVSLLDPTRLSVLEISGAAWRDKFPFKRYRSVGYPEYDVCSSRLDESFDLVIAEQVWEHIAWPVQATANVFAMLRPGGSFLVTTPFMLRVHPVPLDCSRWTEVGLRHLLMGAGFEGNRIQTGSWGNRQCVVGNFSEWAPYNRLTHSLENESEFPVVVWGLATRPQEKKMKDDH